MKRTIIYTTVITLLFSIAFIAVTNHYKHEVPTDEEWNVYLENEEWQKYLAYENELYHEIDEGKYVCDYIIQDMDTKEIYFTGSLADCKLHIKYYECNYGECIIMPVGRGVYNDIIK